MLDPLAYSVANVWAVKTDWQQDGVKHKLFVIK